MERTMDEYTYKQNLLHLALADLERDAWGDCERGDQTYIPGCGEYDTYDSKGARLLPSRNEAGEYVGRM